MGARRDHGGNGALLATAVLALTVPLPALRRDGSVAVEYRDGQPAYVFLSRDDKWRLPVVLDEVDPSFVEALVALEDRRRTVTVERAASRLTH